MENRLIQDDHNLVIDLSNPLEENLESIKKIFNKVNIIYKDLWSASESENIDHNQKLKSSYMSERNNALYYNLKVVESDIIESSPLFIQGSESMIILGAVQYLYEGFEVVKDMVDSYLEGKGDLFHKMFEILINNQYQFIKSMNHEENWL